MAEGRADAYALGSPQASLEDELETLRAGDAVSAELAAMKARIARSEG